MWFCQKKLVPWTIHILSLLKNKLNHLKYYYASTLLYHKWTRSNFFLPCLFSSQFLVKRPRSCTMKICLFMSELSSAQEGDIKETARRRRPKRHKKWPKKPRQHCLSVQPCEMTFLCHQAYHMPKLRNFLPTTSKCFRLSQFTKILLYNDSDDSAVSWGSFWMNTQYWQEPIIGIECISLVSPFMVNRSILRIFHLLNVIVHL